MQFSLLLTLASLGVSAATAAAAAASTCPQNTHRICCQNLNEYNQGYYCGMPQLDGEYACGEQLMPLCCESSGNYPRGYVGQNCQKGANIVVATVTQTVTVCPEATQEPECTSTVA